VDKAGTYALTVRYSNEEQSPASHYNPDPLARPADISVNGGDSRRVLFPHTFHKNNFWEMTVPVVLQAGKNSIAFSSEELPNFDGVSYVSQTFPGILLRSKYAPNIDQIAITPLGSTEPNFTPGALAKNRLPENSERSFGLREQKIPLGTSDVALKNLPSNQWVHVYYNSTSLGWHMADSAGTTTVRVSVPTKSGDNRIIIFDSQGSLIGWEGLKVTSK
jgi:hypothetical protein